MPTIRPAQPGDLPAIQQLLGASGLPYSDLGPDQLAEFLVLDTGGEVIGCVGLERYGSDALLRSLAVEDSRRGTGQGRHLANAIEVQAANSGVTRLYLLTTSAAVFFEGRGFQQIERAEAPLAMQASTQFAQLCPASAVCMAKALAAPAALAAG